MKPPSTTTTTLLITIFNLLLMIPTFYMKPVSSSALSTCRNQCGTMAINYPFGIDQGCGATQYRNMLNCSGDFLFFITPSGNYKVKSIDYQKQTLTIFDPSMTTCTTLQPHHDFVLTDIQSVIMPPTSDTIFALLNCSIDSPVLNHYRNLCFNFSGHSCDELYNTCTAFRIFRVGSGGFGFGLGGSGAANGSGSGGTYPPCCFTSYGTIKAMSMNILDCSHYTSVYDTDGLKGIGPLDWQYGIKMGYSVPNAGCDRCQKSGGTCGFDTETEMMLCICSNISNSTRECIGGSGMGGVHRATQLNIFQVLVLVFGAFINVHLSVSILYQL